MDANKMGAFIASIRKEKGMTQAELASKLFLSDKTISKWERSRSFGQRAGKHGACGSGGQRSVF